jgi:hypothetical protein
VGLKENINLSMNVAPNTQKTPVDKSLATVAVPFELQKV